MNSWEKHTGKSKETALFSKQCGLNDKNHLLLLFERLCLVSNILVPCSHLSPGPSPPGSCTPAIHMENITFTCRTALAVGHAGGEDACSGTQHTQHCCIALRGPSVPGCANKNSGVSAAVAELSSPIILLTVRYTKIQNTGSLQLDNPDAVFSPPNFQCTCSIITTSSNMYLLQKD